MHTDLGLFSEDSLLQNKTFQESAMIENSVETFSSIMPIVARDCVFF